jgi:hypothetical protein
VRLDVDGLVDSSACAGRFRPPLALGSRGVSGGVASDADADDDVGSLPVNELLLELGQLCCV